MFKTIEATIDAQGKIHWQEQPPIQGHCRVLITLLDEPTSSESNKPASLKEAFLQ